MTENRVSSRRRLSLGTSTAGGGQPAHRVGKLTALGIVRGRWLDVGCASGHYTAALRQAGADSVVGIDIEGERLQEARRRWRSVDGVTFSSADIEAAPFPDNAFDGILLNEVLEHVLDEQRALAEMLRILRNGGHLCVFSPNRCFPFEGHRLVIGSHELKPPLPIVPWLPRRVTQRFMVARNYWPRELKGLVQGAGFEIIHIGFAYPLFGTYRWLPGFLVPRWRSATPALESVPLVRRLGVSTLIVGRKPARADGRS